MRTGVGLITLEPSRSNLRHYIKIAAVPKTLPEGTVEEVLECILDKDNK